MAIRRNIVVCLDFDTNTSDAVIVESLSMVARTLVRNLDIHTVDLPEGTKLVQAAIHLHEPQKSPVEDLFGEMHGLSSALRERLERDGPPGTDGEAWRGNPPA